MRSGRLRFRLVIEQDTGDGQSSVGGRSVDWSPILEVRASAAFKSGKEYERAKQITAELTTLFVIRYDSRLDTKDMHAMRVRSLDDESIYKIHYADDPYHTRRTIHIHTSESQHK